MEVIIPILFRYNLLIHIRNITNLEMMEQKIKWVFLWHFKMLPLFTYHVAS